MTPSPDDPKDPVRRSRRGFAGMDPQRVREIARAGGRAAHAQGSAHEFDAQEARLAGLKSQSLRSARHEGEAANALALRVR
nr:KGG domain-containing protein [Variovorax sp. UMC13]